MPANQKVMTADARMTDLNNLFACILNSNGCTISPPYDYAMLLDRFEECFIETVDVCDYSFLSGSLSITVVSGAVTQLTINPTIIIKNNDTQQQITIGSQPVFLPSSVPIGSSLTWTKSNSASSGGVTYSLSHVGSDAVNLTITLVTDTHIISIRNKNIITVGSEPSFTSGDWIIGCDPECTAGWDVLMPYSYAMMQTPKSPEDGDAVQWLSLENIEIKNTATSQIDRLTLLRDYTPADGSWINGETETYHFPIRAKFTVNRQQMTITMFVEVLVNNCCSDGFDGNSILIYKVIPLVSGPQNVLAPADVVYLTDSDIACGIAFTPCRWRDVNISYGTGGNHPNVDLWFYDIYGNEDKIDEHMFTVPNIPGKYYSQGATILGKTAHFIYNYGGMAPAMSSMVIYIDAQGGLPPAKISINNFNEENPPRQIDTSITCQPSMIVRVFNDIGNEVFADEQDGMFRLSNSASAFYDIIVEEYFGCANFSGTITPTHNITQYHTYTQIQHGIRIYTQVPTPFTSPFSLYTNQTQVCDIDAMGYFLINVGISIIT
jgi:hypothetical protein